jgi:hypothetical protein
MTLSTTTRTQAAHDRLTILTSIAYLAVEAENCGDVDLAAILRSSFAGGLESSVQSAPRNLNPDTMFATWDFLRGFLAASPQVQNAIVALLEQNARRNAA